jgi:hypothetical protein
VDERQVGALEPAAADEVGERCVRLLRARDDHEPGCVAVEPVHDPRPLGVVAAADRPRERVDERSRRVAGAGMHDEPGRLVDHEQVLVLERKFRPC